MNEDKENEEGANLRNVRQNRVEKQRKRETLRVQEKERMIFFVLMNKYTAETQKSI